MHYINDVALGFVISRSTVHLLMLLSWRHQEVLDRYHHDAIRRGNRAKSAVPDHETPTIPQRHRITLENKTKNRPTEC